MTNRSQQQFSLDKLPLASKTYAVKGEYNHLTTILILAHVWAQTYPSISGVQQVEVLTFKWDVGWRQGLNS